jgi:pyridoxal phosphate enzyme (YggS family)
MGEIAERLQSVRTRIETVARRHGRAPGDVRLIAVSKTKPAEAVREAYAAGQRDFGENYVQELVHKAHACADLLDIRWHVIGHLQRNKVRQVVPHLAVLHSADSVRLVDEVARRREALVRDVRLPVLIEVNLGGETQKSGCAPAEIGAIGYAVDAHAGLRLAGLMTVPPQTDDPDGAVEYFTRLAELRAEHGGSVRLPELSMGMTHDLEQAIACGATMVRVGTAIFGERDRSAQ